MAEDQPRQKVATRFSMGNEVHLMQEVTSLQFQDKEHTFVVVPSDFPLLEDGIIGIPFLHAYQFNLSNNFLKLDEQSHPLESNAIVIPKNSVKMISVTTNRPDGQIVLIEDNPHVVDCILQVRNSKVVIPISNEGDKDLRLSDEDIKLKFVSSLPKRINAVNYISQQELGTRIKLLKEHLRLQHIEKPTRDIIEKIATTYHDVFALPGDPLPCTSLVKHKIVLKDTQSINIRQPRLPMCHRNEISEQVTEMKEKEIIEESDSSFNFPLWVVPKKRDASGKVKWRIVVDFRKLNEKTDLDGYPLPVIDEIIQNLGRAKFFSSFDLSSGFHHIKLDEDSKKYTAFSTPDGHFHFNRLPFGLKNSPPTFQRMMDTALRGLIGKICFAYLDDIVVFGSTLEEHNRNIVTILERLRVTGLKLQPDKCEFLRPELEFLGHVITEEGVKPNSNKISAVMDFKQPRNQKEVMSFLGLSGYYRKFIKNYSTIAKPLTELTKKDQQFLWSLNCGKSFQALKNCLCSAPVLSYPDFDETFTLTTDASNVGLGAILSQKGHPVCYISRTLNKAEMNYSTTEKELLAIVWAIKRLRQYLLGRKFIIQTDHQALKWLFNVKDPSSRLLRWRLRLEEYEYEIEYKKGKENTAADALSRMYPLKVSAESTEVHQDSNESRIISLDDEQENVLQTDQNNDHQDPVGNEESIEDIDQDNQPIAERLRVREHLKETDVHEEYQAWKIRRQPPRVKLKPIASGKNWIRVCKRNIFSLLRIQLPYYNEKDWINLLYLKIKDFTTSKNWKIIKFHVEDPSINNMEKLRIRDMLDFLVQSKFEDNEFFICERPNKELTIEEKESLLKEAHGNIATGHFGENKTIRRLRDQTVWEDMEKDAIEFIKKCLVCQQEKLTRIRSKAEAVIPDIPIEPNEKIAMDIVGPLGETQSGNNYILSIQDVLTKYLLLIPLKETTSETILTKLLDHYIYIFSAPKHILTDQGSNFISELVQKFENLFRIKHIRTTAFHPQSNGALERTHGTIKDLLRTYMADNETEWDQNLNLVCLAFNTAVHESTGLTPFEMTFGRKANLPSILATTTSFTYQEMLDVWKKRHEEYLERGKRAIIKTQERIKNHIDNNIVRVNPIFEIGDLVLLHNDSKTNKMESEWLGPYTVTRRVNDVNYEILYNSSRYVVHSNRLKLFFY